MKPLTLAFAAAAVFAGPVSLSAQEVRDPATRSATELVLSAKQVRRDVELARDVYSRVHPGYARYASVAEMDQAWAAIIAQAEAQGSMTLPEFYLAVELALTLIRCDHTKAELPELLANARKTDPVYLPFLWNLIDGRGVIDVPGEGNDLERGDEILSIDGRPLSEVVSKVASYVPVDGYTEWSRNGEISQSREFLGGAVDHFGALLWDVPAVAELEIRSPDGSVRKTTVQRVGHDQWTAIGSEAGQIANFKDAVSFQRIGDDAGLLTIDTFVNYRSPVDPQSLYRPVFESLRAEGRDTLILDLRNNGGGSTDASVGLVANLVDTARPFMTEFRVATLDHSPWEGLLTTWDQAALNPDPRGFIANDDGSFTLRDGILEDTSIVQPTDVAFDGRLLILTSTNNSSGSTNILAHLSSRPNTITIGEKTGGSAEGPTAGVIFFLNLPESDITLRVPMFRQWNNVESFEPGLGITPDIAAPMTVDAFLADKDPALEKAFEIAADGWERQSVETQAPSASISDFAPLVGEDWSGELEYLNYGSDTRSTIPVRMIVREPKNRSMAYGFLYPGEEHKNARDKLRISRDGTKLNGMTISRRYLDEEGALVLVTEGSGRDDNRPADIRLTYVISANAFTNRKDVRFEGGEYINRNEYRLYR